MTTGAGGGYDWRSGAARATPRIAMEPPAESQQLEPRKQRDALLGRLAVHEGLITEDQLSEATSLQSREDGRRRLGDIFIAQRWLTEDQVVSLAAQQREAAAATATAAKPAPRAQPRISPQASPSEILATAVEAGASDVHLQSAAPLRFRIDGELRVVSKGAIAPDRVEELITGLMAPDRRDLLTAEGQADFAFGVPGLGRFRGNAYRHRRGVGVILRLIGSRAPTLTELGLPLTLARFTNYQQGLVLVTGPSGCGKTSTMAALLNLINEERREHIITAEEPIEYLHPSRLCIVNQRQVGRHSQSFAQVLRAALRQDPDVIALGDLLDHETISLALTAAETGHLVLGTLHTSGSIRTIDRIIGAFPPAEHEQARVMLSESLRAVVSQRLVRKADGTGRVAALEILVVTRAVSHLIREDKTFQLEGLMQTAKADGMQLLEESLNELVREGVVLREEAARHMLGTGDAKA